MGRRKKQCGQEIGGRLGQLGLLRVFVFNISIHVGRDTMAVCSVIRSVSHTELFLFRGVVHGGVPDRLGERESSEWYHARAVELRSPPRDPSFKRYSKWRGEERGGEGTAIVVRVSRRSSMNGRVLASPYVCISSVYIETIGRTKGTVNLLIPPATDNAIPPPPPPRTIYRSSCGSLCFELARCRTGRRKYTCTRVSRSTDVLPSR